MNNQLTLISSVLAVALGLGILSFTAWCSRHGKARLKGQDGWVYRSKSPSLFRTAIVSQSIIGLAPIAGGIYGIIQFLLK